MSKTALTIQMLMLLKTNQRLKAQEIADILETKKRNISVFKNELEMAGYVIDHKTGPYGGYSLSSNALLPSLDLSEEELISLEQAARFLKAHPDFEYNPAFLSAYTKIKNAHTSIKKVDWNYVREDLKPLSELQKKWIKKIEEGMEFHRRLEILYQGRKDERAFWLIVEPYEFVNQNGKYYLYAYSNRSQGYRSYRLSDERLKEVKLHSSTFAPRSDYRPLQKVGEKEQVKIVVWVSNSIVRFFKEQYWGEELRCQAKQKDGEIYSFISENTRESLNKIFTFQEQVKIVEPESLKNEYRAMLDTILHLYER